MYQKYLDLIEYEQCLESSFENSLFEKAKMLKDFGPLKAGEEYYTIQFDFDEGECNVWLSKDDEEPGIKFKFTLAAM